MALKDFENVSEHYMLFDTVGVFAPQYPDNPTLPPGWFGTLAQLGAVNEIPFFNVRNRNSGLYWNNQDKRDQLAWPFVIKSLGISWHAETMSGAPTWNTDYQFSPEDYSSHIFVNDLPRHAGVVLQIQQDERLKTHAFFCSPGYGVSGGGYARGAPSTFTTPEGGWDHHLAVNTQGLPMINNRWQFPINLEVPRNANLSVRLIINQYGRELLQQLPWVPQWFGDNDQPDNIQGIPQFACIQVSMIGKRLVQQRGQYHR